VVHGVSEWNPRDEIRRLILTRFNRMSLERGRESGLDLRFDRSESDGKKKTLRED
jgi:hypothetical protein